MLCPEETDNGQSGTFRHFFRSTIKPRKQNNGMLVSMFDARQYNSIDAPHFLRQQLSCGTLHVKHGIPDAIGRLSS